MHTRQQVNACCPCGVPGVHADIPGYLKQPLPWALVLDCLGRKLSVSCASCVKHKLHECTKHLNPVLVLFVHSEIPSIHKTYPHLQLFLLNNCDVFCVTKT